MKTEAPLHRFAVSFLNAELATTNTAGLSVKYLTLWIFLHFLCLQTLFQSHMAFRTT